MGNARKKYVIPVDNGHGEDTKGKCSPDKSLMEWAWTREIAARVVAKLVALGYDARLIVKETWDVPLMERVRRVNSLCDQYGKENVILCSVHVDAAGHGREWMEAGGWSCFTTRGKTVSDKLADCFYDAAEVHLAEYKKYFAECKAKGLYGVKQKPIRTDLSDGDRDREADYTILYKTECAAVLTENMFQDNREDVKYLLSEEGKESIVDMHVAAITKYLNQ